MASPRQIEIIEPTSSLLNLKLREVWNYRDLLKMFVRRDFVATYKQTILGPLWFFIQPILTTIMFTIVFGNFAKISTDGKPPILFYLSGLTIWNYFSECFTKTATVFTANAGIFGKVYFPRLIMPLSIITSGLLRLGIQLLLFLCFYGYFILKGNGSVAANFYVFLTPFLIFMMAGYALGAGMIISAMTTKYRDLSFLLTFGVQLLMYATPIIYPVNSLPQKYQRYVMANPLSAIVETFRFAFLGSGHFSWSSLLYSAAGMFVLLLVGIIVFNKVSKSFMDTV